MNSPTYQPTTNPPGFTAKQVANPPDSCSRRELIVKTFLARYKDDGISHEVDTNIAVPQSTSREDREIGKRFAPLWEVLAEKLKVLSTLKEMVQVPSLSLQSTYDHWFLVSRIAGRAWENQCSNFLNLETNGCLILLLLICVFLVFLMMYYDRLFLKPAFWLRIARPVCDGRRFTSSPFRRLASRGLARTTPYRACSFPPYGLVKVNPY